jgi:hypothetical protein
MGGALIEEVRRRYSARASVLHDAGFRRSSTEEFLRSFTARWEEAAALFFQSLASLSREAAREGDGPSVKGRPSAGAESPASPAGRSFGGKPLGGDELAAAPRSAGGLPAGTSPAGGRLRSAEDARAALFRRSGREESPAEDVRAEDGSGGFPPLLPSAGEAFHAASQAPAEAGQARWKLEGTRAPGKEEREEPGTRLGSPLPDGRAGREEGLPPQARGARREALQSAEALTTPPRAPEPSGTLDVAQPRPRETGGETGAPGDRRGRPRLPEGADALALPASLELDREGDAVLERLEAFLDERKQLEEALREWECKGF